MKVSVIITVKNEEHSIRSLLDSLAAQTRSPDEVVVVDGGSSDGTVKILESYSGLPLRILVRPGCNISEGRNAAISSASGEIIASTDAGVRLSPNWLEKLLHPFVAGKAQVVSGFFLPDPQTAFERAMGATVLPALEDIDPRLFLPSSRSVAFRKEAWERVGGYPEWLDYCEDLIFDFRLRALYGPFPFAPEAVAYFRPRASLSAFFLQYFRYARGDGKADLWRKRHAIRYLTYLLAMPLLVALGLRQSPFWFALLLLGLALYLRRPYQRLWGLSAGLPWRERLEAAFWVPLIRLTGDLAKMLGYPVGLVWRLKNLHREEVRNWRINVSGILPDE